MTSASIVIVLVFIVFTMRGYVHASRQQDQQGSAWAICCSYRSAIVMQDILSSRPARSRTPITALRCNGYILRRIRASRRGRDVCQRSWTKERADKFSLRSYQKTLRSATSKVVLIGMPYCLLSTVL